MRDTTAACLPLRASLLIGFALSLAGTPALAGGGVPLTPNGPVYTKNPTYTWQAGTNVSYYMIAVDTAAGQPYFRKGGYTPGGVCSGGTCAATPPNQLTLGNYVWYVMTTFKDGTESWSAGKAFSASGPPAPVTSQPQGTVLTPYPTFTWQTSTSATEYLLAIDTNPAYPGVGGPWLRQWSPASTVCSGSACSKTLTTAIPVGPYKWYIAGKNAVGEGPWSTGKTITVQVPAPTQVSPNAPTADATPTYTWTAAPGVTEYHLEVDSTPAGGGGGPVVLTWYQASAVCSGSTCAATPTGALPAGPYAWFLLPKNASGEGSWSSAMSFQVQTLPAPQQVGPSGLSATNQPTYRWLPVAGATGYSLWVDDATPAPIIRQSYSTSVCTATECAVTPNVTLGPGGHTWYVLTRSEAGDGPLSPGMSFVTPSWSGGTSCEGAFRAADFNADGRTDRLCSQFGVTTVQLSTGSGFASPAAWLDGEFAHQLGYPVVGDFNGDGAADVAAYDGTTKVFQVALSTGTHFLPLPAWGTASASWAGQTYSCGGTGSARPGTGNFDANGYADIHCRDGSGTKILVGKSTGASFTFGVFADFSCGGAYERAGPADLDGDGRDDWYCIDGYGGFFARLSNGVAFEDGTFQGLTGVCEKDDWSLADINGDARTDVACRPNGFVGLSTGAAILDSQSTGPWCNNEQTFPSGQILRSQMQAMDVDGDGRPELVCTYAGQFVRDVHFRKWTGETLGPVQTLVEQWCIGSIQGGDFDGDGKFELVCDNGWAIGSGTPNVVPDLMIEATNGIGGKTTASYAPSSTFGCNKPPVRQVLTSLTGHDGRGASSTTSYTYCGGRSDPAEGAFLGYQQVRATAPCLAGESTCPYTETEYSQELRTLGRPTLVRRSNGAGQALRQTQTFFHPQTGPSLPRQALVKEVRTTDFALSGGDSKTTSVTYLYDTHGNVTQQVSHGLVTATGEEIPNDELQADITYWEADAERYLVSLPHTTQQREQRGQGLTLVKSVETAYNAVGGLRSVRTSVLPGTTVLERTMEYTSSGNLWRVTSELGALTTITYDGDDLHPETVTNPDGTVTTTWHDACGLPETVTNPNGIIATEYDEMCRPTRTEGPYDPSAPPTAEKPFSERFYLDLGDPSLQRVRVEGPSSSGGGNDYSEESFDGLGRTRKTVRRGPSESGPISTTRTYNARGGLASVTAPYYGDTPTDTTLYAYDPFDRLAQVTNPDGTTSTKSYGLWSETTTDPAGKATTVQRTTTTAVESTTIDGETATTTQTFDLLGRRLRLQDHRQNAWTWSYDSLDRVLSQYDPDAGTRTTTYNDATRQQTEVAPVNPSVTLTFDSLGRLIQKTSGAGTATLQYGETRGEYSNWGRLTTVTSPGGTTLTIDYDAAGQVLQQVRTIGSIPYTVIREYDPAGRMTGQMYPNGYVLGKIGGLGTPMGYDDAGRLTSIAGILTNVTYDAAGRPLTQTNANGTVTTRTYLPERGVLDTLVTTGPGGTVQSLDYGYDPDLPLVTSVQSPTPGEGWTYGYDDAYRLTSSTNHTNPADNQTFDYDSLGRMTYNSRLGIYAYPQDGQPRPHAPQNVGGASYSYHANGNLNTGGGRTPTWDAENRIAALGATTFSYDAFGERLSKNSPAGTSLYPFGDDYEVSGTTTTAYVSVEGLGVIAKHVIASGVSSTFWHHTDRLGSIQAVTDAAGAVVYRRTYRPYGETLGTTGTHTESRGWIDQRNDSETGLTYLHARYFDPKLGTFLSPDPIGVAGGMNLYGYGLGDPVNGADRSGLLKDQCEETNDPYCRSFVSDPMMSMGMGVFLNAVSAPGGGIPGFSPALAGAVAEWEEGLIAGGHGGAYAYADSEGGVSVTLDPGSVAHDVCAADPARCINQGIRMGFVHVDTGVTLEWGTRAAAYEIRGPQQACMILGRVPPLIDPYMIGGRQLPVHRLPPSRTLPARPGPRVTPPRPYVPVPQPIQLPPPPIPPWWLRAMEELFRFFGGDPGAPGAPGTLPPTVPPDCDWCA